MLTQRSQGIGGIKVLLHDCEIFANLRLKLYRVSLRAARDANWVYFIPDRDPPLIVARGGASVSGDHYIIFIVHMHISPRGRTSRGAVDIKINISS